MLIIGLGRGDTILDAGAEGIDDKRDESTGMPDPIVGRDLRKAARPGLARPSAVVSTLAPTSAVHAPGRTLTVAT